MESDNKQRVPDIDLRFVSASLFLTTGSILCLKLAGCLILGYFRAMVELTGELRNYFTNAHRLSPYYINLHALSVGFFRFVVSS